MDWFNSVDATYRANLLELNEANFGRFDAKLGERLAEVRAELKLEVGDRFRSLESRLVELRAELKMEFGDRLRSLESRLVRWMLAFWVTTLMGLGGLFFRG